MDPKLNKIEKMGPEGHLAPILGSGTSEEVGWAEVLELASSQMFI